MSYRVNALMHAVQATCFGTLTGSILRDAEPTQLLKHHKPVLLVGNPPNLPVHSLPTGLKAIYIFALSPVGGGG